MSGSSQEMTALGSAGDAWNLSLVETRSEFLRLEAYAMGPKALGTPLDEVEQEIERRAREVARLTLQANIDRRGTGDQGAALIVIDPEGPPRRYTARREDKRGITSLFGKVSVRRRAYTAVGVPAVSLYCQLAPYCKGFRHRQECLCYISLSAPVSTSCLGKKRTGMGAFGMG